MRPIHLLVGVGLTAVGVLAVPASPVRAANSPTFRDCSIFVEGFDPDYVQISGVTVTPQGTLTVLPSQTSVQVRASESSDPGDNLGHVTLSVAVAGSRGPARMLSGAGTGSVVLRVPLIGSGTGKTYTISWAATFDNGNHLCPSPQTPDNTAPNPFIVTVT